MPSTTGGLVVPVAPGSAVGTPQAVDPTSRTSSATQAGRHGRFAAHFRVLRRSPRRPLSASDESWAPRGTGDPFARARKQARCAAGRGVAEVPMLLTGAGQHASSEEV